MTRSENGDKERKYKSTEEDKGKGEGGEEGKWKGRKEN
jgi:hypothetical protein